MVDPIWNIRKEIIKENAESLLKNEEIGGVEGLDGGGNVHPTWKRQKDHPWICTKHSRRASGKSSSLSCKARATPRSPLSFS